MSAKFFLDTNILIYLLQGKDVSPDASLSIAEQTANRKADIALELLDQDQPVIAVQVCNELCNVVQRRKMDWNKAQVLLETLEALCDTIVPLSLAVHKKGLLLREKYQLQLYDAMLLAAALEAECTVFYSEDMQNGQLIERTLVIRNPFK